MVGNLIGITAADADSGADVATKTTGVFTLPKTSAQAWSVGALIYWDPDDRVATTVSTDNTLIGKALVIAANPSGTGIVRLNG